MTRREKERTLGLTRLKTTNVKIITTSWFTKRVGAKRAGVKEHEPLFHSVSKFPYF